MMLVTLSTFLLFAVTATSVTVNSKRASNFAAPHYSLYLNNELTFESWPGPDKVQPYNRVLMAFWQTNGAQATPASWAQFSEDQRQTIIKRYHGAGIALMVSAFGDDDHVISNKADPTKTAQDLASWVKQYSLDGVDIDMEDFTPLQSNKEFALNWLTTFHLELASQLPSDTYVISSTPTAWMYGSAFGGADGVYCKLHSSAGKLISWYNMQLYNGHPNTWNTCENTFWKSADPAFLSIKEISDQCSIPLNQIAAGKLWDTSDLATPDVADEIPPPEEFGACISQAKAQIGYPETGIMIWAAHMDNWDGAINYLKHTLSALEPAPVTVAPTSSSTLGGPLNHSNNGTTTYPFGSDGTSPSGMDNVSGRGSSAASDQNTAGPMPSAEDSGSKGHSGPAEALGASSSGSTKSHASVGLAVAPTVLLWVANAVVYV